jgi:hypothetical protein
MCVTRRASGPIHVPQPFAVLAWRNAKDRVVGFLAPVPFAKVASALAPIGEAGSGSATTTASIAKTVLAPVETDAGTSKFGEETR